MENKTNTENDLIANADYYPLSIKDNPLLSITFEEENQPYIEIMAGVPAMNKTCTGYVLLLEPGTYHFMAEADDSATMSIAGFGSREVAPGRLSPSGVLTLQDVAAGFYKITVDYSNIDYRPVELNAAALKISQTGPNAAPPALGYYDGGSTEWCRFSDAEQTLVYTIKPKDK